MSATTGVAPSAEWVNLARVAARQGAGGEEVELLRELLSFRLAGSPYAIAVERIREIVRLRELTPVPKVPSWVLGVVALRGEVVQVVDLRMRLGLETPQKTRRSRIIVLHGDDDSVTGLLVDSVQEVLRIKEGSISPTSSGEMGAVSELCLRDEEFVSIVDVDRVLDLRVEQ